MSQQKKATVLKRRWSACGVSPEIPEKKLFKSLPGELTYTTIATRNSSQNRQAKLINEKTKVPPRDPKSSACSSQQEATTTKGDANDVAAESTQNVDKPKVVRNERDTVGAADQALQSRLLKRKILVARRALESVKRAFLQRFEQGELLGVGSFGKVYAGIRREDQLPVAIKYIPKRHAQYIEVGPNITIPAEVYFQRQLDHPNIIKLLEHHYFDGHHVLVTERPPQCTDLFEYLTLYDNNSVDEAEGKRIFRQLFDAVEYLESKGVLHNDLKPENVLLDLSDDAKVKLIDFGLAWKLKEEPITTFSGTPEFCPPEYHITHQYDGRQATVWSLGCFLFDMLTGNPPFLNARIAAISTLDIPKSLSKDARDFLGLMLEKRPWKRASLSSLKEHAWLKSFTTH